MANATRRRKTVAVDNGFNECQKQDLLSSIKCPTNSSFKFLPSNISAVEDFSIDDVEEVYYSKSESLNKLSSLNDDCNNATMNNHSIQCDKPDRNKSQLSLTMRSDESKVCLSSKWNHIRNKYICKCYLLKLCFLNQLSNEKFGRETIESFSLSNKISKIIRKSWFITWNTNIISSRKKNLYQITNLLSSIDLV